MYVQARERQAYNQYVRKPSDKRSLAKSVIKVIIMCMTSPSEMVAVYMWQTLYMWQTRLATDQ